MHPTSNLLSRRDFLCAGAGALLAGRGWSSSLTAAAILRLVLVTSSRDALTSGVTLGVEEAQHTAKLLGGSLALVRLENWRDEGVRRALEGDEPVVIVAAGDATMMREVATIADGVGVPLIVAGGDDARADGCHGYRVAPTREMFARALAAATAASPQGTGARVVVWDATFQRYGAAQLNDRYRARFGSAMTSDAWCGWMAVKVATESVFRSRARTTDDVARWLASPRARFDGHKGVALTFRPADRLLRQPLLVVSSGGVSEVPRVPRGSDASFDDIFDAHLPPAAGCGVHS